MSRGGHSRCTADLKCSSQDGDAAPSGESFAKHSGRPKLHEPTEVVHPSNPVLQEEDAEGRSDVQPHPQLHRQSEASLGYMRPSLQKGERGGGVGEGKRREERKAASLRGQEIEERPGGARTRHRPLLSTSCTQASPPSKHHSVASSASQRG